MKILAAILFAVLLFSTAPSQTISSPSNGAKNGASDADGQLNTVYKKLLGKFAADTVFVTNLRASQRLWVQFRDAQVALQFTTRGSVHLGARIPANEDAYRDRLTADRTKVLSGLLVTHTHGLAAHYAFNASSNDEDVSGLPAPMVRAEPAAGRSGMDGGAYRFDGEWSVVDCGNILNEIFCAPVAKFTVCGWAKTRTCGSFMNGGGFIVGKSAGSLGPYQWNITHADGVVYAAVFSDARAHAYVAVTSPMAAGLWFHFALVFDGSLPEMQRVRLYVDGLSSATTVYRHEGVLGTATAASKQHLTIGATHEANTPGSLRNNYDGDIDDIRLYDRALTTAEIRELYFSE